MPQYDFNHLERRAAELKQLGRWGDALRIYIFMSDGDPSLDGGYLGLMIGECYRAEGRLQEAKYWFSRALDENPDVHAERVREALAELGDTAIDYLL